MPDGRTINLKTVATVTSFLGYRRPTIPTRPAYTALGEEVDLPVILPSFEQKLMTENLDLKDGQTLVLGGLVSSQTVEMSDEVPILGDIPLLRHLFQKHSQSVQNKDLLVLITVTIVDSAGNPVHPHDTMAWAQDPVLPP
jgi:type II secretory pathway component GspD/PulD (secretin)